jgi:hypothetical protein
MEHDTVNDAIHRLRADGQKVTVRAVHGITKGSRRDVHRLMRDAAEWLDDAELTAPETESAAPVPALVPSLGRILETSQSERAAEAAASEASTMMDRAREQLQRLLTHVPPHATTPAQVQESVAARLAHDAEMQQVRQKSFSSSGCTRGTKRKRGPSVRTARRSGSARRTCGRP